MMAMALEATTGMSDSKPSSSSVDVQLEVDAVDGILGDEEEKEEGEEELMKDEDAKRSEAKRI